LFLTPADVPDIISTDWFAIQTLKGEAVGENVNEMPDVGSIIKRTVRRSFEDGIGEMAYGIAFILIGLVFFGEAALKPLFPHFWSVSFILVVWGTLLLSRWLVPAIKKRLVFPRTGYVVARKLSGRLRWLLPGLAAILGGAAGLIFGFMFRAHPGVRGWIPTILGIEVCGWLLFLGFGLVVTRFLVLAAFSVFAGLAASLTRLGGQRGSALYFAAMGLALVISGALALRAFLRRAPAPEEQ
jgi:hypothetical protein